MYLMEEFMPTKAPASLYTRALKCVNVLGFIVLVISAVLCMVAFAQLSPVFKDVESIVHKAQVLFDLVYRYGCVEDNILTVSECNILKEYLP